MSFKCHAYLCWAVYTFCMRWHLLCKGLVQIYFSTVNGLCYLYINNIPYNTYHKLDNTNSGQWKMGFSSSTINLLTGASGNPVKVSQQHACLLSPPKGTPGRWSRHPMASRSIFSTSWMKMSVAHYEREHTYTSLYVLLEKLLHGSRHHVWCVVKGGNLCVWNKMCFYFTFPQYMCLQVNRSQTCHTKRT